MADKTEDKREAEILRRMTESIGALSRAQAEIAVDFQAADDAERAKREAEAKKIADEAAKKAAADKK